MRFSNLLNISEYRKHSINSSWTKKGDFVIQYELVTVTALIDSPRISRVDYFISGYGTVNSIRGHNNDKNEKRINCLQTQPVDAD